VTRVKRRKEMRGGEEVRKGEERRGRERRKRKEDKPNQSKAKPLCRRYNNVHNKSENILKRHSVFSFSLEC
jgi:hypothetical protein